MRKFVAILLALVLILAFPVSVSAVTSPKRVSEVSGGSSEAGEPTAYNERYNSDWHFWLRNWYRWWSRTRH